MPENKALTTLGRAERVDFPELQVMGVPARVDTGAKTSAIWASRIHEEDGVLTFTLFDSSSEYYTGEVIPTKAYLQRGVASSTGVTEVRYVVRFLVHLQGRKIRASFTLANRSKQVYPVLIGRNVLRGKFLVDVKQGTVLIDRERQRAKELRAYRKNHKEQA